MIFVGVENRLTRGLGIRVRMRERRSNSFVRPDGWRRGGCFRVAFFPRRSRSRIRVTRRRRNQCAVERKATRRTKPGPARPFFFAGQPSNFTTLHLPAFFLRLLLPSFLAQRPSLFFPSPRLGIQRGGGLSLSSHWKL